MEPYTVALTSCGRFDLLERTLRTLLPRLDGPLAGVLVVEDSGDPRVRDVIGQFTGYFGKIDVIINDPPLGQVKSIDRLYQAIETEWIFHCEDDWEFFADEFVEESFTILKEFDCFSMVNLADFNGREEFFASNRCLPGPLSFSGVRFFALDPFIMDRSFRPLAGLSFNPGLRRMRDYRIIGPYRNVGVTERLVSNCYQKLGFSHAALAAPACRHLGYGRHLHDHVAPFTVGGKMAVYAKKRWASLRRRLAPERDPVRKALRRLEKAEGDLPGAIASSRARLTAL